MAGFEWQTSESEATTLSTEPQQLPFQLTFSLFPNYLKQRTPAVAYLFVLLHRYKL